MELLKIGLNIQIQTKALNGGLLNRFRKRFKNEIQIFSKSEIDLGLRNKKNIHAMKCNLLNYSKIFYPYLGEMHYLDKFYLFISKN
jgi:PHP family Zn ribbon phosphoesterase